jgi:hypothetical protein
MPDGNRSVGVSRRNLLYGFGALSLCGITPRGDVTRPFASTVGKIAQTRSGPDQFPTTVAGVRLVDSKIARNAMQLARATSAPYLFNHAVRTYLLGSIIGRARAQHFDKELLFLACILHDLGLTDQYEGELPFEIEGAEAARRFLEENGYPGQGIEIVWDGIAMHASPIGRFKQPEISLVGAGAGADVLGPDSSQITKSDLGEILKAFPRLGFKTAFVKTCVQVVRKYPAGASRSFMRDVAERYVEGYRPKNFCDLIAGAPFAE